jgi:uncharacterized cofD-like protein
VVGQVNVAESHGAISSVSIVPPDAPVPDDVLDAIASADQVVVGPGSLFTSVLAVCAVPGIRRALTEATAQIVYVCNLRPQLPETANFTSSDHLRAVLDHGVPVSVMVAHDEGRPPEGTPSSDQVVHGIPTLFAPLSNAEGTAHDPGLLALALRGLT